jgi:hypothetical protein
MFKLALKTTQSTHVSSLSLLGQEGSTLCAYVPTGGIQCLAPDFLFQHFFTVMY